MIHFAFAFSTISPASTRVIEIKTEHGTRYFYFIEAQKPHNGNLHMPEGHVGRILNECRYVIS